MERQPQRLLVMVNSRHDADAREAWEHPHVLVTRALRFLRHDTLITPDDVYHGSGCRLMAVERWPTYIFIVCDLFNDAYDFDTAHIEGRNDLPVTVLRLRQSEARPFKVDGDGQGASPQIQRVVNDSLREAHENHGWHIQPPFKTDHADGVYPVYHAPRCGGRDRVKLDVEVTYSRNA